MNIEKISSLAELEAKANEGSLCGLYWVDSDDYHLGPGISSTDLKALIRSPAHYRAHKALERKDTKALKMGKAIHCAILENDVFHEKYKFGEKIDRRTAEGKKKQAERDLIPGITWIEQDEFMMLAGISRSLWANKKFISAMSGAKCEITAYWIDEQTGLLCKARADILNKGIIFDLKTTTDARPEAFQRDLIRYKYHLSAAWYLEGFRQLGVADNHFSWFAIEKEAPYGFKIYSANDELLEAGLIEAKRALKTYSNAKHFDDWFCYTDKVEIMGLPKYYQFEGEDE